MSHLKRPLPRRSEISPLIIIGRLSTSNAILDAETEDKIVSKEARPDLQSKSLTLCPSSPSISIEISDSRMYSSAVLSVPLSTRRRILNRCMRSHSRPATSVRTARIIMARRSVVVRLLAVFWRDDGGTGIATKFLPDASSVAGVESIVSCFNAGSCI